MKFSTAALVSTFFRHFLFSGTILFSTKNSDVLAASAGFKIWRFKVTRDGTDNHICINAFRFIRLDGTLAIPIAVQVTLTGSNYGQSALELAFNVNDKTGINGSRHWCGWGHSDIIVTFANEETFGSYKFIPHSHSCTNDPQTWFIEGKKTNDPNWTHLSDEDHDCPLPHLDGYNEYDITTMTSSTSSPSKRPSSVPTTNPSENPSLSLSPSSTPTMTAPRLNSWDISSTGGVTEEVTSKDLILIKLPFNSTNMNIGALILKKDCTSSFDIAEYPYFVADTSTPSSTHPDGYMQFNTTLELNVTSINRTQYWNAFTDGSRGGWVEACVETFLTFKDNINLGNDDSPEKVVFSNTVLNISVSLTATYEVDEVDIEREEAANDSISTDYSKFITAYQCGELDVYTKKTTTYTQGDDITICVTDASTDIVQVEQFVDLVVTQSGVSDYNYINNGMWNPDITTPVCVDASTASNRRVCYAKIRALARFFRSENPLDLTISGSVYVIRDGRRVIRKLHNALPAPENNNKKDGVDASARRSKEEGNGSAQFGVTVGLASTSDSTVSGGTIESIVTCLTTMVVGAAGASLIV